MIPKIEDGNTFGVEVQENMLVQLRRKLLEAEAELLIWWAEIAERAELAQLLSSAQSFQNKCQLSSAQCFQNSLCSSELAELTQLSKNKPKFTTLSRGVLETVFRMRNLHADAYWRKRSLSSWTRYNDFQTGEQWRNQRLHAGNKQLCVNVAYWFQYIYEADERHCRKLQDGARLIRSQYNVLYRSITQNYDKITRPRGHANKNNMLIY